MGSPERLKGNIITKAVRFATVPIAVILAGCADDGLHIPACAEDSQPKTRTETLFPGSAGLKKLSVDGIDIKAVLPAGRIEAKAGPRVKNYVDGHVEFQDKKNGRLYSINAEPYDYHNKNINPDLTASPDLNVTLVTIQAACETSTPK